MEKERFKKFWLPTAIAAVQWLLTTILQVDRLFFSYDGIPIRMLMVKVLYFIFLLASWNFIFSVIRRVRSGDEKYKRGLFIFTFYLSIMMLLLLILWPGTWSGDALGGLLRISSYHSFFEWHHFITGVYQDVLLQILPFPGGIIFLQNIIISVCIAFAITKLEQIFKIKRMKWKYLDVFVKVLPFLLPPVIFYQFSGYRMGLYVYLELVMLVMLVDAIKSKEKWSLGYTGLFIILCIIVSTWRTESFFYILFASILILFVKKEFIPKRRKIICVLLLVAGFICVDQYQKLELGSHNYKVISVVCPSTELVKVADPQADAALLADIDKVAKLDVVYQNPTINGEELYWHYDLVRSKYTDQDYYDYLNAVVKLSLKYPKTVFAERWNTFIHGSGITGFTDPNISSAARLFDSDNSDRYAVGVLGEEWIATRPMISEGLRKTWINILGLQIGDGSWNTVLQILVWNALFPIAALIYAWIELLIKKKWLLWLTCTAVVIKLPVVILTEPASWIMYLISFYLLGYVYLVFRSLIFWSQRVERKKNAG